MGFPVFAQCFCYVYCVPSAPVPGTVPIPVISKSFFVVFLKLFTVVFNISRFSDLDKVPLFIAKSGEYHKIFVSIDDRFLLDHRLIIIKDLHDKSVQACVQYAASALLVFFFQGTYHFFPAVYPHKVVDSEVFQAFGNRYELPVADLTV